MADKSVLIMPGEVTGAQAALMQQALSRNGGARRSGKRTRARTSKKRRRKSATRARSRTRSSSRATKRLVKGSAAAKRHMAKLRRMRRK